MKECREKVFEATDDEYDILGMQRYITMTVELIDMTVDSQNTMLDYFTKVKVLPSSPSKIVSMSGASSS